MNVITPSRGQHLTAAPKGRWQRFIARRFHALLDRIDGALDHGTIEIVLPDSTYRVLGARGAGPIAKLIINRWRAFVRLGRSGSIGWYEAWEDGDWESHDPVPLFDLILRNRRGMGRIARGSGLAWLARRIGHLLRRNNRRGSRRNIIAHYDLGNDFYKAWLDPTMSYSSALFKEPLNGEEKLETAQKRKLQAIGRRLQLPPDADVLEIGSGWGYFSRLCAEKGHRVTGITLSHAQKAYADHASAKMASPPQFRLVDYRDVEGEFDAIASIEMVEAVGQHYWPAYLDAIARLLRPGGRAAIQYIAIADDIFESYARGVDFIQTYVFPGGMLLSESRFRELAEQRGLGWQDRHEFGIHYAETLRRWRIRFDEAVENGKLPKGFDAKFVRLWRYYLMYCEGGFRSGGIFVAQVTLVKQQ